MTHKLWTAVDRYITQKLVPSDPVLDEALRANAAAGFPSLDVSPNEGKLLYLLARIRGAKRILEIGTLGGYSTIWLARALPPDGKLFTLEANPKHADVALSNIARAGLSSVVEVRKGAALDSLARLERGGVAPFDFIFIDADKRNNPTYLQWALRFSRLGTVIVTDNVVRDGAVVDAHNSDPDIRGTRALFDMIASEPRLDATALQTVGGKGYDGFCLAVVVK
jgi:predicted O-methyltransferase YrrM